ncbi:hypothetical protein D9M68_796060 [compost metagenome]
MVWSLLLHTVILVPRRMDSLRAMARVPTKSLAREVSLLVAMVDRKLGAARKAKTAARAKVTMSSIKVKPC